MSEGSGQDLIVFACGKCGKKYRVPKSAAGKHAKCACGEGIVVPAASAPEEPVMMYEVVEQEEAGAGPPQPVQESTVQPGLASADLARSLVAKKAAKKKQTIIALCAIAGVLLMGLLAWIPGGGGGSSTPEPAKDGAPPVVASDLTKKYVALLTSPDNALRSDAAFNLGEQPRTQAQFIAPELVKAYKAEQSPKTREAMQKAIGRLHINLTPK